MPLSLSFCQSTSFSLSLTHTLTKEAVLLLDDITLEREKKKLQPESRGRARVRTSWLRADKGGGVEGWRVGGDVEAVIPSGEVMEVDPERDKGEER